MTVKYIGIHDKSVTAQTAMNITKRNNFALLSGSPKALGLRGLNDVGDNVDDVIIMTI